MSVLDVPGGQLFFEVDGHGPLLVLIPGAAGTGEVFGPLAHHLSPEWTVLRYDRRGFSRSTWVQAPVDGSRLRTEADDVRRLIGQVAAAGPAVVLGVSSGALVALAAATTAPEVVEVTVAFEPPAFRLLPDGGDWVRFLTDVHALYRDRGAEPALEVFRERAFPAGDRQLMAHAPRQPANTAFWFEHELRQYPALELDLPALTAVRGRIVPAVGAEGAGYPCHEATLELGRRLRREVAVLPGGHLGFIARPREFALALTAALHPVLDPAAGEPGRRVGVAAEASVEVVDPVRYLDQLCRHAEHLRGRSGSLPAHTHPDARADGPVVRAVERSGTSATLVLDRGRCVLRADDGVLSVRVEAADDAGLRRIQAVIGADLARFGAREAVEVNWRRPGQRSAG